jgi:hypothetical protein
VPHLGGVGKYVSQIQGWSVHSQESGDLQVPLGTIGGLVGDVTIDGRGIANNPLLLVSDCHNVMTCAVGCLCPH